MAPSLGFCFKFRAFSITIYRPLPFAFVGKVVRGQPRKWKKSQGSSGDSPRCCGELAGAAGAVCLSWREGVAAFTQCAGSGNRGMVGT